jgi:hypothetical protein
MLSLRNCLKLLSYLVLSESYYFYRFARRAHYFLTGNKHPRPLPDFRQMRAVVEGFSHSGNSFVRSNIGVDAPIVTHFHRLWAVRRGIALNLPTILLIRRPLEVAESWYFRTSRDGSAQVPIWVTLMCWIAFYERAWRYRDSILVLSFSELTGDYERMRRRLWEFAALDVARIPRVDWMNQYEGPCPPIALSKIEKELLARADELYARYMRLDLREPARERMPEHPSGLGQYRYLTQRGIASISERDVAPTLFPVPSQAPQSPANHSRL